MAFIIAGSSIVWQEEKLKLAVAILIHMLTLYVCYLFTYLINGWLLAQLNVVGIFTVIFISGNLFIWSIIYLIEKRRAKDFNLKLNSYI